MIGTEVSQVDGKLGTFLSSLDDSYSYVYDTPIRCDQCSEVIHPNNPTRVLFADRFIGEDEAETSFRLVRIECEDCSFHDLHYSAPDYTEILLNARFTPESTMTDTHLLAKSGRSEGLDWDPVEVRRIFDPEGRAITEMSPSDFIRMLSRHFDPRKLIDPDTGEILVHESEYEAIRLFFAMSHYKGERTKDDIRALKQSAEDDVTEAEIEQRMRSLERKLEEYIRTPFNSP